MNEYILNKVENMMAKGEIACIEQFLLLTQCFQKSYAADELEIWNASTSGKVLIK